MSIVSGEKLSTELLLFLDFSLSGSPGVAVDPEFFSGVLRRMLDSLTFVVGFGGGVVRIKFVEPFKLGIQIA